MQKNLDKIIKFTDQYDLVNYSIIKYINVAVGVVQGFVQVWVFTRYLFGSDLSYILFLYGLLNYFALFDLGLGRPVYANIRSVFISGDRLKTIQAVGQAVNMYVYIVTLTSLIFVVIGCVGVGAFKATYPLVSIVFLSISLGISVGLGFFRGIHEAMDRYRYFEYIDLVRRIAQVIGSLTIILDQRLFSLSVIYLVSFSILLFISIQGIINSIGVKIIDLRFSRLVSGFKRYRNDMKNYFLFKINEVLIYNWGFLIMPFISDNAILAYSVWNRLFLGISIPIRTLTDILIHPMTRLYHQNNRKAFGTIFKLDLLVSLLVGSGALSILYSYRNWISNNWLNGKLDLNIWILGTVGLWVFGNLLQHPSGKLLLSLGGNFTKMRNISLVIAILTIIIILAGLILNFNYIVMIFVSGLIYFFGSYIYFLRARSLWN